MGHQNFLGQVAVPFLSAVKEPEPSCFKTEVLLLDQVILYEAVPFGRVALKLNFSPTPKVSVDLFIVTSDGEGRTVTLQVAVLPLKVFTVTVAVPSLRAL